MTEKFLGKLGAEVEKRYIDKDPDHRQWMIDNGHSTTPTTLIGESIIKGYKPQDLEKALVVLKRGAIENI